MKTQKLLLIAFTLCVFFIACKKNVDDIFEFVPPTENNPSVGVETNKGNPIGTLKTKVIGSSGGTLTSDDATFILTVPAGALSMNTEIGIQRIVNHSPNGLKDAYRIISPNVKLNKKLSICWNFNRESVNGIRLKNVALAYQNNKRIWEATKDVHIDERDSSICFNNIDNLENSDWSFVSSICMKSNNTDTVMLGSVENFMITGTSIGNKYWNPLPKEKVFLSPDIVATTVNGIDFGDNVYGSFSEEGYAEGDFSARYIAPKYKVPNINLIELKAIIKTAPDLMEEVTTFIKLRRGSNSLSIAAEGSAVLPTSFGQFYEDKRLSLTVWDNDIQTPKMMTTAHFEIKNFNPSKVGSYSSGELVEVSAWRTGGRIWNNHYLVNVPFQPNITKYGDGSVNITSITPVPGAKNGSTQGTIIKGNYNFTCYRLKPEGENKYFNTGVTGTFETFMYL